MKVLLDFARLRAGLALKEVGGAAGIELGHQSFEGGFGEADFEPIKEH
jgi:hypothetical protein